MKFPTVPPSVSDAAMAALAAMVECHRDGACGKHLGEYGDAVAVMCAAELVERGYPRAAAALLDALNTSAERAREAEAAALNLAKARESGGGVN